MNEQQMKQVVEALTRVANDIAYVAFNIDGKKLEDLPAGIVESTGVSETALIAERNVRELIALFSHHPASQPADHIPGAAKMIDAGLGAVAALPAVSPALKTWPEEVFLSTGEDEELAPFEEYSDVSWCDHPTNSVDVRYVREDVADKAAAFKCAMRAAPPSEAKAAPVDAHFNAMQIVHEEAGRTLSRDDFDLCMRIAKRALSQQPAVPDAQKIEWDVSRSLQIDSYMTDREGVVAHIAGGRIHLEITDGSSTWRGTAPFPKDWRGRAVAAPMQDSSKGIADVTAERQRQMSTEGWTPEHDDEHVDGDMAEAAACYITGMMEWSLADTSQRWPWAHAWWKPKDRRRNLVRAAALIVAEIDRIDRAAIAAEGSGK